MSGDLSYFQVNDRSTWRSGPWDDEPDKVEFIDQSTGLACLAVRGPLGQWNGYVGLPEDHPWFQADFSETRENDAIWPPEVHGGLTYSDFDQIGTKSSPVNNVDTRTDHIRLWWLGFDCAHIGDIVPGVDAILSSPFELHGQYRALDYVRTQCASLAGQAAAASAISPAAEDGET